MNNKILISFLVLTVILVTVYLTISTFYETSREESYGIKVISPSVSYNRIKSSRPVIGKASSSYQMEDINKQAPFSSAAFNSRSTRNGAGVVGRSAGNNNLSQQPTVGSLQPEFSTSPGIGVARRQLPEVSGGNFSSMMLPGLSGKTSNKTSSTSSSGLIAFHGNNSSSQSSYVPFSEGGSSGLPDPGGNADDSCDDDIVFIPVPDGLPFLIFLSILYALMKLFFIKKNILLSTLQTRLLLKRRYTIKHGKHGMQGMHHITTPISKNHFPFI